MSLRKAFFIICLIISALCLAAGYGIAGQWIGAVTAILMAPFWLFARKYGNTWLPPICLLVSVGLSVAGCLAGAPSLLMVFSSGFSLAAWDLLFLNASLGRDLSGWQTCQYEIKHIQSLALGLGLGLFVAALGSLITFQIPFALLVLFVAVAVFGLDRALGLIPKKHIDR